jgi:hypothetical protein
MVGLEGQPPTGAIPMHEDAASAEAARVDTQEANEQEDDEDEDDVDEDGFPRVEDPCEDIRVCGVTYQYVSMLMTS